MSQRSRFLSHLLYSTILLLATARQARRKGLLRSGCLSLHLQPLSEIEELLPGDQSPGPSRPALHSGYIAPVDLRRQAFPDLTAAVGGRYYQTLRVNQLLSVKLLSALTALPPRPGLFDNTDLQRKPA